MEEREQDSQGSFGLKDEGFFLTAWGRRLPYSEFRSLLRKGA